MSMKFLLPLALLLTSVLGDEHCQLSHHGRNQSVKLELANGAIEGYISTSREGHEYEAFEGIPFGKVVKRFADPIPAEKWEGVLNAKQRAPPCYSTGMFSAAVENEDCLKLDIYSPVQASFKELLPVMVWIYGGGFLEGATNQYGPDNIMDSADVVLVMINYRLGAFGFLNTGSKSARGNQGLKDQVLALKWVQENIHHFSGNKDLVTIFGESAGSISVALHVTSPMSKGLFHRAIMQSGTIATPFRNYMADGWRIAKRLGKASDCPTSDREGLVKCLQRIDPKVFLNLFQKMGEFALGIGPGLETYSEGENDTHVFMKGDPLLLAESGNFNKVPIVMGLLAFENMQYAGWTMIHSTLKMLNHQWGRYMQAMLYLSEDAEDPALAAAAIREKFVSHNEGDKLPMLTKDKAMELELLMSERHLIHPLRLTVAAMAKHTTVFVYNFTFNPVITRHADISSGVKPFIIDYPEDQKRRRPTHGDDLPFLFKLTGVIAETFGQCGKGHEDFEWSKEFLKAWTSFAKTGNFSSSPWTEWSPVKGGEELFTSSYLEIDKPPRFVQVPELWKENHKFWDSLRLKSWGGKWVSEENAS